MNDGPVAAGARASCGNDDLEQQLDTHHTEQLHDTKNCTTKKSSLLGWKKYAWICTEVSRRCVNKAQMAVALAPPLGGYSGAMWWWNQPLLLDYGRSDLCSQWRKEDDNKHTTAMHGSNKPYYWSSGDHHGGQEDSSRYHTEPPVKEVHSSSFSEFFNGAAASFVNIIITFPANKLMFRQQVEGLRIWDAFHSMKVDGLVRLYRGIGPPLLQRSVSMSLMFGLYDQYYKYLTNHNILTSHYPASILAALFAGSTEAVLCPFERIQTILQHRNFTHEFANTVDVARKLYPYGIKEYYRGLTAILLRNGPSNVLFFTLRKPLRELFPPAKENEALWNMTRDFFSGAMLGAFLSTTFFPLNVVKTVMQAKYNEPYQSVLYTLKETLRERKGITGLFRGVQINFTRSLLSWGIINTSYEFFRQNNTFGFTGND